MSAGCLVDISTTLGVQTGTEGAVGGPFPYYRLDVNPRIDNSQIDSPQHPQHQET